MKFYKYTYMITVIGASILVFVALIHFFQGDLSLKENKKAPEKSISDSLSSSPLPNENLNNLNSESDIIGIWVPYLDLETCSSDNIENKFKNKFELIIEKAKEFHADTLIVHVRSHNDALYPSQLFPWSHLLTGIQGKDPGFDPLKYMVSRCHESNLKFHAWINPLRVKALTYPKELSKSNPFFKFDSEKYFLHHADGICYNPAYKEVRQLIVEGVKEIVSNYSVDAIHFDDYFYPNPETLTSEDKAYKEYINDSNVPEKMSLEQWRKRCINLLVEEVYNEIKSINPKIDFGISPPGNLKKCEEAGIDLNFWCNENKKCVDYICPQIYWSTKYSIMPFEKVAKEWKKAIGNSKVKLYGGVAVYKAGTELDNGTWKIENDILSKEISILKNLNYKGTMLYSWKHLNEPKSESELKHLRERLSSGF